MNLPPELIGLKSDRKQARIGQALSLHDILLLADSNDYMASLLKELGLHNYLSFLVDQEEQGLPMVE